MPERNRRRRQSSKTPSSPSESGATPKRSKMATAESVGRSPGACVDYNTSDGEPREMSFDKFKSKEEPHLTLQMVFTELMSKLDSISADLRTEIRCLKQCMSHLGRTRDTHMAARHEIDTM